MGVKGLSKGVIKLAWRDDALSRLPAGLRVGVDAAGWLAGTNERTSWF